MRIATLILGLILGAMFAMQAVLVTGLSGMAEDDATGAAGAIGLLAVLLWLVASALVIPAPVVAAITFGFAGLLCVAGSGEYGDLSMWGVASLVLSGMALLGWRGKRKQDAEKRLLLQAAESQKVMAGMMVGNYAPMPTHGVRAAAAPAAATALAPTPSGVRCPACGEANGASARFCADCGAALVAGAPKPA
jgi:hypothetical protein